VRSKREYAIVGVRSSIMAESYAFEFFPDFLVGSRVHAWRSRLTVDRPRDPMEIEEKQLRMSVDSPTGAARDTFEAYGELLRKLEDAFPLQPGQCGAVLAIGDDLCLDTVSRPDAFRLLWPKLRAGYLLDALERLDQQPTDADRITGFVDEVADAVVTRGPSAGLGEDVRLRGPGVIGSGLELDGERIQLSAFTSSDDGQRALRPLTRSQRRRD
jgi:hypothetical protein